MYEFGAAKGCLVIACYLSSHGPTTKYSLVRDLKLGKEAISRALEILENLGLCRIEELDEFPFTKTVSLTSQGVELMKVPIGKLPMFFWQMND